MRSTSAFCLALLMWLLATLCQSAQATESLVIADLRERLGLELPATDTLMACPGRLPEGLCLRIEHDTATAEVSHLGLALFEPAMQQALYPEVWRAAERVLLQLVLLPTEGERKRWLEGWGIRLMAGTRTYGSKRFPHLDRIYPVLRSHPDVEVLTEDERIKLLLGDPDEGGEVRLSLPKNRELLQGTDKKEADERLQRLLQSYAGSASVPELPTRAELQPTQDPLVWRQQGSALYINTLRSDGSFTVREDAAADDAAVRPLWSPLHPGESMRNLLLGWYLPEDLTLNVQHRQYGGQSQGWRQPWASLLGALTAGADVQTYAACQHKADEPMCTGILVVKDDVLGIAHMLLLAAPVAWLGSHEPAQLDALLFTNIPHSNLYSLFR